MVYVSEDTGSELSPDVRHGWANLSIASLQYPGPRPSGSASFRTRHPPTLSFTVGVRKRLGRLTLKSRLTCCWVLGGQPTGRCLHSWDFGGCSFHGGQGHGAPSSARSGTLLPPWPVPRSTQSLRCAPGPGHHRSGPGAQNARSCPVPGFLHPSALREQGGAEEERVARTCEGEERCCIALRPGHRGAVLSPLRGA